MPGNALRAGPVKGPARIAAAQLPAKETERDSGIRVAGPRGVLGDVCECPAAQATGGLAALSDERTLWLRRLLDAELAAERRGYERGIGDGYAQCAAEVKAAEHAIATGIRRACGPDDRWQLRGEPRTRETFAEPHPDDYVPRRGQESNVA